MKEKRGGNKITLKRSSAKTLVKGGKRRRKTDQNHIIIKKKSAKDKSFKACFDVHNHTHIQEHGTHTGIQYCLG